MKIKLLIVFLLVFPFIVNFSTTSSYACSCIEPGTAVEELERSDFVFSGKVIEIRDPKADAAEKSSADLLELHFDVSHTWKGVDETEILIYTERDSASCGFNFTIDNEYLVYGNENDGKKSVSLCSKTTLLANAADDLTALGDGKKPSIAVNLETGDKVAGTESSMTLSITIFAAAVFFIIMVSYMIVKKNAR